MNRHQNRHGSIIGEFDLETAKWRLPITTPNDWTNVSDLTVKLRNYVALEGNTGAYLGIAPSTTELGYKLVITMCSPRIEVGIRSA